MRYEPLPWTFSIVVADVHFNSIGVRIGGIKCWAIAADSVPVSRSGVARLLNHTY